MSKNAKIRMWYCISKTDSRMYRIDKSLVKLKVCDEIRFQVDSKVWYGRAS